MMNGTDPALAHFSGVLKATVDTGNTSRLRGFLSGRELPALGGDQEPADIIRSAILEIAEPSAFAQRLSELLASILTEETTRLSAGHPFNQQQRNLLNNIFYLAIDLPAENDLFQALGGLQKELAGNSENFARLQIPLWQALVYQQVDSSLERTWLSLLGPSSEAWTPSRRTLLLTAWRGLLWIPPDPEMQKAGEVIDFNRIYLGLINLAEAVNGHEKSAALLEAAISILSETYPRSAEFWRWHLKPQDTRWPGQLQEILASRRLAKFLKTVSGEDDLVSGEDDLISRRIYLEDKLRLLHKELSSAVPELGRQIEEANSRALRDSEAEIQRRLIKDLALKRRLLKKNPTR